MKRKRKNNTQSFIGIASIIISIASAVWIGGFQFSTIMHDIKDIKEDIKEIKVRLDKLEDGFHKMDLRVTTIEQQHKP